METPELSALRLLRGKLRERMNDLADVLAQGGARSYEHYKELCGEIHGLALAERDLLDLVQAAKDDENE